MRIYTVHLRRPAFDSDRDVVLVREGFNWWACLFSTLWALVSRLWWVAAGLLLLELLLTIGFDRLPLTTATAAAVSVGAALMVGFLANDLKRWTLFRRGYAEVGVVAADSAEAAAQRFFDQHPRLLADLRQ
jgi:hypothetical protein